ncbi:murein hydrolase activator EnvC [Jannaschia sp. W003]|uniref:murein hydrolase activator EnvC family protein n=1 Tax=Jannaschia sp. W003 TaxID=2867012 RepID=UPI0021A6F3F6|nr:peptidoglycan DD-metalloendopeptidase family protein [Jannaschia sp. W003]UWQ21902.1 peptidoglycan DD-metalloendopeptidase family protein [Jannaschia sp. W003]
MIRAALLALLLALPVPAAAVEAARAAAAMLEDAARRLERARGAGDRIAALTEAVQAYEAGLAALREGLRAVAVQETALAGDLDAREDRVSRLIGVLSGIERTPAPLLMLHPGGPLGTARAAMLLGDAAPALEAQAAALRADLAALRDLRALREAAMGDLEAGLGGIAAAREALSEAISERGTLPDPPGGAALAALVARAGTLRAFADGLADLPGGPPLDAALTLPLPLPGDLRLLRGFREPDAAGISRPGLVLAAAPGALLTAPASATVRYAGPLLDYGLVIVLEPRAGALVVVAGLHESYVRRGDILAAGAPLGLMGGDAPEAVEFRSGAGGGGGAFRPETLYVETREGGVPVDPSTWFDLSGAASKSE